MAVSKELSRLLQENLDKVQEPSSYASLRKKLLQLRPKHSAPAVKQSPENSLKIESFRDEIDPEAAV
jgi:hypothetical protein